YSLEWAVGSARAWSAWAEEREAWEEADEAYGYGLEAVEQLFRIQLFGEGQQSWLAETRDLARYAAYTQARLGRLTDAVTTLEQNRTRALSEVLEYQGPAIQAVSNADRAALLRVRRVINDLRGAAPAADEAGGRDVIGRSK